MSYEICSICGGMYEKDGRPYCQNCFEENQREYKLVVDYIEQNPRNTVLEVTTETKVPLKTINRFVEEGIVSFKDEGK